MSTTLTDKIVKVRKDRICFSCSRKFPKGTEMHYWSGIYDGDFGSVHYCRTCEDIMNLSEPDDEGWPEGFVREMLDKDQTPEQLLEVMKSEKLNHA